MSGWAAMAQIGSDLLQGYMADERQEDLLHAQEMQQDKNIAMQREFAQHGVQWRVQDAKEAGVHPMYALSSGGAAFSNNPIVLPGDSGAGKHYGKALSGGVELLAALFAQTQKKDEALAAAALSNASLGASLAQSATPFPSVPDYTPGSEMEWPVRTGSSNLNLQNAVDVSQFKPQQHISTQLGDPSSTAGPAMAGGTLFQLSPDFKMYLPSVQGGGASEALESLSESWELAHLYVQRNVEAFGPEWLDQAQRYLPMTATLAKVINNVRNAASWIEPTWDALGHASRDWIRERQEHYREVQGMRTKQDNALSNRFRRANPQFFRRR